MKAPGFLYFSTTKFVVIKDIRVGIALRCLQALVLFYVLFDVLKKGSYLETETPIGISTSWYDENTLRTFNEKDIAALPYCRQPQTYDFQRTEQLKYTNFSCIYKRDGVVSKTGNTITFTTNMADDKLFYVRKPSAAQCNLNGSRYLKNAVFDRYVAGACIYTRKRNFLPVGVETLNMTFWHSYSTSTVGESGSLPETFIRRKGNNTDLLVVPKGKTPSLSVQQWLNFAGVDLDKRLDEQIWYKKNGTLKPDEGLLGIGQSTNTYPKLRVMGVQVLMTINYYNYEMGPGMLAGPKTTKGHVKAVIELEPVLVWSGAGSNVVYMNRRVDDPVHLIVGATPLGDDNDAPDFSSTNLNSNGVVFVFNAGGALGRFQYRSLITSLIQGKVLLGIAHTLMNFVVLFGLGFASKLYREFVKEGVNARREYARFAAQAIVAGRVFHDMDKNGSGSLTSHEVYRELSNVLDHRLDDRKRQFLTDFLMRHGDEDEDTVKKGMKKGEEVEVIESKLSLEEFVQIFTQDKVNFEALERIIDSEYKDVTLDDDFVKQLKGANTIKKADV